MCVMVPSGRQKALALLRIMLQREVLTRWEGGGGGGEDIGACFVMVLEFWYALTDENIGGLLAKYCIILFPFNFNHFHIKVTHFLSQNTVSGHELTTGSEVKK